jgi:hypothetical protein
MSTDNQVCFAHLHNEYTAAAAQFDELMAPYDLYTKRKVIAHFTKSYRDLTLGAQLFFARMMFEEYIDSNSISPPFGSVFAQHQLDAIKAMTATAVRSKFNQATTLLQQGDEATARLHFSAIMQTSLISSIPYRRFADISTIDTNNLDRNDVTCSFGARVAYMYDVMLKEIRAKCEATTYLLQNQPIHVVIQEIMEASKSSNITK